MRGEDVEKVEGDGRAPAGVFRLGATWIRATSKRAFCVDDPGSPDYNRIVRLPRGAPRNWTSAERMTMYDAAVVVEYNTKRTPYAGSCIFVHASAGPTAGCTAVARGDMAKLLPLLEPGTILVQLPRSEYQMLRASTRMSPWIGPLP